MSGAAGIVVGMGITILAAAVMGWAVDRDDLPRNYLCPIFIITAVAGAAGVALTVAGIFPQ